jgi:hypothetical protein
MSQICSLAAIKFSIFVCLKSLPHMDTRVEYVLFAEVVEDPLNLLLGIGKVSFCSQTVSHYCVVIINASSSIFTSDGTDVSLAKVP